MDRFELGTLYQTFTRTAAKCGDRPAYAVPPMAGRAYHPDGTEYTWTETAAAVEVMRQKYADAGYGYGHRIAILFEHRPEFLFHYSALNGPGCSVVPINPDYRQDEIAYLLEHPESPADVGESLARELMAWCNERLAYFKAPAWYLFVERLPTGTSQKVQKINLFAAGVTRAGRTA
jgi:acyl-CoA synthetase (AMP-forming)/AMP-acid ligase II